MFFYHFSQIKCNVNYKKKKVKSNFCDNFNLNNLAKIIKISEIIFAILLGKFY
jgi:hypothetical protein